MNEEAFAQADADWLELTGDARRWLKGPLGGLLQQESQRLLNQELARYFGGYLVHYGPSAMPPQGATQIKCSVAIGAPLPGVHIACDEQSWPLSEHAADVVVLEHGLDFSLSPHDLLREAARSVRPGGHLLIIGINPWSSWGLRHLFARDALAQAHLGAMYDKGRGVAQDYAAALKWYRLAADQGNAPVAATEIDRLCAQWVVAGKYQHAIAAFKACMDTDAWPCVGGEEVIEITPWQVSVLDRSWTSLTAGQGR